MIPEDEENVQSDRECLGLGLFDLPELLQSCLPAVVVVTLVPMDVLVLLPAAGGRVNTMSEVVLKQNEGPV